MGEIARKRALGVPRGLLKFIVLKMLNEKPMAGAEIVEEIEVQTNGRWKPSSGSIYPLMSWMTKKGFTKEVPKNEEGLKRYSFTPKGQRFFQEQMRRGQEFIRKIEFLTPMLIGGLQLGPNQEKLVTLREPARDLIQEFMSLIHNADILTPIAITKINEALRDCLEKLQKIAQKPNHAQ